MLDHNFRSRLIFVGFSSSAFDLDGATNGWLRISEGLVVVNWNLEFEDEEELRTNGGSIVELLEIAPT